MDVSFVCSPHAYTIQYLIEGHSPKISKSFFSLAFSSLVLCFINSRYFSLPKILAQGVHGAPSRFTHLWGHPETLPAIRWGITGLT